MQAPDLKDILNSSESLIKFAENISQLGGDCIVVGGTVRDLFLNSRAKDLDIEVHGITVEQLEQTLRQYARFKSVGRSFRVWKCRFEGTSVDIDCSIPFNEKGEPCPHIGFSAAAKRRDFTMNSMGYHIQKQTLLDPFDGQKDIQDRIIRMTGTTQMLSDPLRFFRAVQFAGRFKMCIEPSIIALASTADFGQLSHERVRGEVEKLFLKSKNTRLGVKFAIEMGLFEAYLPELNTTPWKIDAEPFNRLNTIINDNRLRCIHMYWALLFIETEHQQILEGLEKLGIVGKKAQQISLLSQNWLSMVKSNDEVSLKFLAEKVSIADLFMLSISYAPEKSNTIRDNQKIAMEANVYHEPLPTLVEGGTLHKMGYRGTHIRELLKMIRNEQLNNRINSRQEALTLLQSKPPESQ